MSVGFEVLANFDGAERILPENKTPAEKNKWDRPKLEYDFIKSGGDWYAKAVFTDTVKDADGLPVFSDKDFKESAYASPQTAEYYFYDGILYVYADGIPIYSGPEEEFDRNDSEHSANSAAFGFGFGNLAAILMTDADGDAVFSAEVRKWFSKTVAVCTAYYVSADGERTPYTKSAFASGYGEDLSFGWETIDSADSVAYSYTSKNNRAETVEIYAETYKSNVKETFQIWDNKTVPVWNGDCAERVSRLIKFKYPDKKTQIVPPSLPQDQKSVSTN
jgi:hypothetical protein